MNKNSIKSLSGIDDQQSWLDMIDKTGFNANYNQEIDASSMWETAFMPEMNSIADVSYEYSNIPGADFNYNPNIDPSSQAWLGF